MSNIYLINIFILNQKVYFLFSGTISPVGLCLKLKLKLYSCIYDIDKIPEIGEILVKIKSFYEKDHVKLYCFSVPEKELQKGTIIEAFENGIKLNISYIFNYIHRPLARKKLFLRIIQNKIIIETKKQQIINSLLSEEYSLKDKCYLLKAVFLPKKTFLFSEEKGLKSDSSFELFKYYVQQGKSAYFVTNKKAIECEKNQILKKHMIVRNSFQHRKYLLQCKRVVTSWSLNDCLGQVLKDIQLNQINFEWIFIPHGVTAGDKDSFELSKYNWGNADIVFSALKIEEDIFHNQLGYPKVETTGYPRFDKWKKNNNNKDLAIFFSWRRLLYDPEKFKNSLYLRQIENLLKEIMIHYPEKNIYYFIHPAISMENQEYLRQRLVSVYPKVKFICNDDDSENFIDVCNNCSCLITDYSSIAFDFSYKKSKVVHFLPNGFCEGGYTIQPKFYDIAQGYIASTVEECIRYLSFHDDFSSNNVFSFYDNHNSERVYNFLEEK